jgi:hypothetical protein
MARQGRQHGRHHAVRGFHQGRRQAHEAVNALEPSGPRWVNGVKLIRTGRVF